MQPSYNSFGYATTVNTSFTPIMATTYNQQLVNGQRSIMSSDAADTGAGTGARTVRVTYYDQTLAGPFTEDFTLNGLTPVNSGAFDICFIESIVVLTVGAQLGNVGTISLKAAVAGGGVTIGSIAPGDNRTQWAHHYVAAGRVARLSNIVSSVLGLGLGEIHMRQSTPTIVNTPEQNIAPVMLVPPNTMQQIQLTSPIIVFGPSRIVLYARSRVTYNQDWQASFGFGEQ